MNPETVEIETVDISVSVTDGTDPIQGVTVTVADSECTTGSAGGCTLRNVPVGDITVTATKDGYESYSDSEIITDETESLSIELIETEQR